MVTRLKREGDGFTLTLDKPLLDRLQINPDAPVEVTADGNRLIVTGVKDECGDAEFDRIVDDMNKRYGEMFRRLAE